MKTFLPEDERMMIRFAQFIYMHELEEQEIQDDEYISELLEEFLEDYEDVEDDEEWEHITPASGLSDSFLLYLA